MRDFFLFPSLRRGDSKTPNRIMISVFTADQGFPLKRGTKGEDANKTKGEETQER
jgi:hypothetical protein